MKIEDVHISISPLTGNVYINTFSKRDAMSANQKTDRTEEFLYVAIKYFKENNILNFKDKKYKVTMEEING